MPRRSLCAEAKRAAPGRRHGSDSLLIQRLVGQGGEANALEDDPLSEQIG
jgi:hypothetical protein